MARGDRGIAAPADLRGKTVGVTTGTDAHYLLSVILAAHRTDPGTVRTVGMKSEQLAQALAAGEVDAIASWDPWLANARMAAEPQAVSFSAESGLALWFHLMGMRDAVVAQPATMERLLRALRRAELYVKAEPAAARAIVARATGLDAAIFAQGWPNYSLKLKLPQGLLLMLSRVSRQEPVRETVDVSAAAQAIAERLAGAMPGRRIEFRVQPGLSAHPDPRLLDIALTNLLDNACKFTAGRDPARIEVGADPGAGAAAFFVRDNDVGFDMAHAAKLFGAFRRLHRTSEFPGTGIGLAAVQRIVHRHGGRIRAEATVGRRAAGPRSTSC